MAKREPAPGKKPPAKRVRKPKRKMVHQALFTATFRENPNAHLKCTCNFPDGCDGSRLIGCVGCTPEPSDSPPRCVCEACAPHGVTGCQGCPNCLAAECAVCGKRDPSVTVIDGAQWTCSMECTRQSFAVAPL